MQRPLLRQLGDAAVVLDPKTWQTHVLPPTAAVVADIITELSAHAPVTDERVKAAIREELELDPDDPAIRDLLRMLSEIGMLGE